jgi:glycosyltransferase involved in cell wall biosynthesis
MVSLLRNGPFVDECRAVTRDVYVFHTPRLRSLSTLSTLGSLRALIRRNGIDVVVGNMSMGQIYGSLAALGTKAVPVWFQHGIVDAPDVVDRLAMNLPAAATFVPSQAAERALRRCSADAPVRVIREGIDSAVFDPATHKRGALRHELQIESDAPIIATIGRLQSSKGHTRFLEAAALISRRIAGAHFVVVGSEFPGLDIGYGNELRRLASRLLPANAVHFLGHREDIPSILADVDLLIQCPTAPESFGLVLVEAMAMRVPVISVRAWGPMEIIEDDVTGTLIDEPGAAALADAAVALWGDPSKRARIGSAARRRVEDRFSVGRMVADLEGQLELAARPGAA